MSALVARLLPRFLAPALALLACSVPVFAQAHAEIVIGADAAGRLRVVYDASQPFKLPASRFPGIDGYAEVFPGFSTVIGARAAADFVALEPRADIEFVLLGTDPGLTVWNDKGTAPMKPGESFRLGHPTFDSHPVWNIRADESGASYAMRLRVRDTSGSYAESDVFAPAFARDDATEVFICPMGCRGGAYYDAAGRCPECGMALKLLAGRNYRVAIIEEGTPGPPRAGAPVTLRFRVASPSGEPVTDFEVVHEKRLHLLMVSNDLAWFSHEHPELQADGSFLLSTTFPHAGEFTLYNDFTPPRVGMQVVPVGVTVVGDTGATNATGATGVEPAVAPTPLASSRVRTRTVDGYGVTLSAPPELTSLITQELRFRIEREGRPVTDLEPFLGTLGHLIVISEDRSHFVHSHPLAASEGAEPSTPGPTVLFSLLFPAPGRYKAWAQFQHEGRVLTADFVLEVVAPH